MRKNEYLSISEAAGILGISRIAVYKKVKKGGIASIKVGKIYAIPRENVMQRVRKIKGHPLSKAEKEKITLAVKKTVKDYGEVLRKLGAE